MINELLLSEQERIIKEKALDFVKSIPRSLLLDMDSEKIKYPKEFLKLAAKYDLLGLRFPEKYSGKGLGWAS